MSCTDLDTRRHRPADSWRRPPLFGGIRSRLDVRTGPELLLGPTGIGRVLDEPARRLVHHHRAFGFREGEGEAADALPRPSRCLGPCAAHVAARIVPNVVRDL